MFVARKFKQPKFGPSIINVSDPSASPLSAIRQWEVWQRSNWAGQYLRLAKSIELPKERKRLTRTWLMAAITLQLVGTIKGAVQGAGAEGIHFSHPLLGPKWRRNSYIHEFVALTHRRGMTNRKWHFLRTQRSVGQTHACITDNPQFMRMQTYHTFIPQIAGCLIHKSLVTNEVKRGDAFISSLDLIHPNSFS